MTVRLVGLMSVVLLLSLAAFGLLMSRHQELVMQEVARTASEVGRATLRTFEFQGLADVRGADAKVLSWQADPESKDPSFATVERFERRIVHSVDGERIEVHETAEGDEARRLAECLGLAEGARTAEANFFINVEEVHAEPDPALGLVLKIPRLAPAEGGESGQVNVMVDREEIQLPIPTGDYQALYDKVRGRSLFLFLGVFAVGVAMSTGLASRFTRPIRRLDSGIRRVSDGELDVRVDVQGTDEIARLSRGFNEMTAKLRANRERARDVVRREKLSALGRLAAGVAHDVRNPLHSIGLTLQQLNEACRPKEAEAAEEFDQSVDVIRGEIRRLDALVANFLRFARSERRPREEVDVGSLLEETARLVRKEAELRRVELALEVEPGLPDILVDGEALRSSILNLVLNGFEAMPQGGSLTLTAAREGEEIRLEVADTGQGIPAEHLEHVFEFAYTTREGGSGLGLAMVHHCVVEEHGGRVALDSKAGEGTRVKIWLPRRAR